MKIQASHSKMEGTLMYNQRKVEKEVARILCAVNLPSAFPDDIFETFSRYENRNRVTDKVSFQLSINPDPSRPEEHLTDKEAREFAAALMAGLGYGAQPYVVYEHQDIDRTHYHVVSIRTDWEGKKIKDFREQYRCQQLLKENAQRFHYKVGEGAGWKKALEKPLSTRFNPKAGDIRGQYRTLFRAAAEYRFTTLAQFKAVCSSKGLILDTRDAPPGMEFFLQGVGTDGKPVVQRISGQELKEDLYGLFKARVSECKELAPVPKAERMRLAREVSTALTRSRSEDSFVSMLSRRGIHASIFRTRDGGEIYGATFVDDRSKTVFKGSELPGITTAVYRTADERWSAASLKEEAAVLVNEVSTSVAQSFEDDPTRMPSFREEAGEDYSGPDAVVEDWEFDAVDVALGVASGILGHANDFGKASKDDAKVFKKRKQKVIKRRH